MPRTDKNYFGLIPVAAILASVFLFSFFAQRSANFDPAMGGFAKNMKVYSDYEYDGVTVLQSRQPHILAETVIEQQAEGRKVVVWLGNSQLHTISDYEEGDAITVYHANRAADEDDGVLFHISMSYGNPNPTELLAAYMGMRDNGATPDYVVFALTYDDFREPGLRQIFRPKKNDDLVALNEPGIDYVFSEIDQRKKARKAAPVERSATDNTLQEQLEQYLVSKLEKIWPAYGYRGNVQGQIVLESKNAISSLVVGSIERSAIRIGSKDEMNGMAAIQALARLAKMDGTQLFIYRVPIRALQGSSYYVTDEYDDFFASLLDYCNSNGIECNDLSTLVPGPDFGTTSSGAVDFFHFNNNGHLLLGNAVNAWISEQSN